MKFGSLDWQNRNRIQTTSVIKKSRFAESRICFTVGSVDIELMA
ncbi:hypothetical protein [Saccharibacillus sacchari]|uniref:Uncharacterized protein n=1 Tax=Saccharibacillus sacchari TaxID=456493 RepID=A0ACC6PKF8_9BACL